MKSFVEMMKEAQMKNQPIITLLTDFGNENGFVGVMKGVILQIVPQARIIDITHDLPPFSISSAAFLNDWSYGYFPVGTIHLCVVDPGVGTRRRILVVEHAGHQFVAPDNGLLTPLFFQEEIQVYHAVNDRYWLDTISQTFQGRDIFSPIAAHLANGIPASAMGDLIDNPIRLHIQPPKVEHGMIDCHIRYIDRFGNLITDLDRKTFERWSEECGCKDHEIILLFQDQCIEGISHAYGERKYGELVAIFNGYNRLEIAIVGSNAAITTGLGLDASIKICASWVV